MSITAFITIIIIIISISLNIKILFGLSSCQFRACFVSIAYTLALNSKQKSLMLPNEHYHRQRCSNRFCKTEFVKLCIYTSIFTVYITISLYFCLSLLLYMFVCIVVICHCHIYEPNCAALAGWLSKCSNG